LKVKIKMNVPKPPTGMTGVTFFGSCYKWKDVFYRMGEEYTINKADFNPAIMVNLEAPKKGPTIIHPVVEDPVVELNTPDEIITSKEWRLTHDENGMPIEDSKPSEKRKHRKK